MFKPSLRVLFPEMADRIFLRLPRALLHWAALSSNSVAFLSLGWRGYMPPGVTSPHCVPETHHSGVPIPSGAGPGGVLLRFSL